MGEPDISVSERQAVAAHASAMRPPTRALLANAATALALGGIVGIGLSGALGGGTVKPIVALTDPGLSVKLEAPQRVRSGSIGEIRLQVESESGLRAPVIEIPGSWLRGVTVNETSPAPVRESLGEDGVRLHFDPIGPGRRFELTMSYQINPDHMGRNDGTVRVYDRERAIASFPVTLWVLP